MSNRFGSNHNNNNAQYQEFDGENSSGFRHGLENGLQSFENFLDRIGETVENWSGNVWNFVKGGACGSSCGGNNNHHNSATHVGVVKSIHLIGDDPENIPESYRNRCYHFIELEDGEKFVLKLKNVYWSDIESQVQPGKLVQIIYQKPYNRVVNIYPVRHTRVTTWGSFMSRPELHPIDPESVIRVVTLDDNLQLVEILSEEQLEKLKQD